MKTLLGAALMSALIAAPGVAFAQQVSDAQIKQNLESQGYSNIQISRHEASHVDVTASKNGKTEKLAVNPKTGQVPMDTDKDED